MQVASLDLGTNTFHLLMARIKDGKPCVWHKEKISVHLGIESSAKGWELTELSLDRAREALSSFACLLKQAKPNLVLGVATAAFRMACNGEAILGELSKESGIPLKVISGEEEALLIYAGIQSQMPAQGTGLIVDIGGGSIELALCTPKEIYWKASMPLGARLLSSYIHADPCSAADRKTIHKHLETHLEPLKEMIRQHPPSYLLGTSGTFTTLYALQKGFPLHGFSSLDVANTKQLCEQLLSLSHDARNQLGKMSANRTRLMVPGSLVVLYLLAHTSVKELFVSSQALKEGLLFKLSEHLLAGKTDNQPFISSLF